MLARYLRLTLATLLGLAVVLLMGFWQVSKLLAVLSFASALLAYSVVLGLQCAALSRVNRFDPAPSPSAKQLLHAWLKETWIAAKVFCWWQPFRANAFPDQLQSHDDANSSRGVLLVHGFVCNRGLWTTWYPVLRQRGVAHVALNLEPVFGRIDAYSELLDRAVADLWAATGQAPLVICHSMGGIAARAWLRAANDDGRVHRIVTIGSPHRGTCVGDMLPALSIIENAQQVRFSSAWLAELARQETPSRLAKFVCFYSSCDNIVMPASSATLPGADNRHVPGLPHLALATDAKIREQALALI